MRELVRDDAGGVIVQLTSAEYRALDGLAKAIEGIDYHNPFDRPFERDVKMDDAFKAIELWIDAARSFKSAAVILDALKDSTADVRKKSATEPVPSIDD